MLLIIDQLNENLVDWIIDLIKEKCIFHPLLDESRIKDEWIEWYRHYEVRKPWNPTGRKISNQLYVLIELISAIKILFRFFYDYLLASSIINGHFAKYSTAAGPITKVYTNIIAKLPYWFDA